MIRAVSKRLARSLLRWYLRQLERRIDARSFDLLLSAEIDRISAALELLQ